MPEKESLQIESLTIGTDLNKQFISVQCELTNGMKSPVFKSLMSDTGDDAHVTTTKLSAEQTVRTVKAHTREIGITTSIMGVKLLDADGNTIGSFEPSGEEQSSTFQEEVRTLKEGHRIVGVYGVKDDARAFTSFGFIVKEHTS